MKACTRCGEVKPLTEFGACKRRPLGRTSDCKSCIAERTRQWRLANPQKAAQHNADHRARYPPEKRASYRREWVARNPDKVRATTRKQKQRERAQLSTCYVVDKLVCDGLLTRAQCTPELIEAKRQQLQLHRAIKQMESVLNEGANQ